MMRKIFAMLLIAVFTLSAAALAESEDVIERFTDTWVAEDFSAEIWYDDEAGGFQCDLALNDDSFCDFGKCRYDAATDTLICEDGRRYNATYNENTAEYDEEVLSEGLTAAFTEAGDRLTCEDSEGLLKGVEFMRLDDAEELDGRTLAEGSERFTVADMDDARGLIEEAFEAYEGCEMHSLRYAGDACVTQENLAWLGGLNDKKYTDCMEFLSDFHSPVAGGGAWEPDKEYTDYQWWLAREEGGEWELVPRGY